MLNERLEKVKESGHIFLTGVTGVLGANLLKEILETTKSKVTCLVRANSKEHARERILHFLKAYDPKLNILAAFMDRVHPVIGDVVNPNFGLSEKQYVELTQSVDVTVHVAANTNLFLSYRRIQGVNVGGAENAIEFALRTKQQYLCYVSTHTVMGNKVFDSTLSFKETDLDIGQEFEYMSYQKSKFVAEHMVKAAAGRGLSWNIFRPGQIFGDSRTGFYPQGQSNVSGLFYDIFKTIIETGVGLISKTHFDISPVNYVSQGIIQLGLKRPRYSETYHLTNPHIKRYGEVAMMVSEQGYPMEFVDETEYKRRLYNRELRHKGMEYKSSTISAFKWWYKKSIFDFTDSCVTDCKYTSGILKNSGVTCQRIDDNLIGLYVDEAIRWNLFPQRTKVLPRSRVATAWPLKEHEV